MAESPKKIDAHITWTPKFCKQCLTCVSICPVKNLEFKDDEMVSLDKCTQCGLCQKYCPDFAIEVEAQKKRKKGEGGESGAGKGEAQEAGE
jgi:2-oxoglutarate ferredoxin oxidoreductase subunit delta